MNRQDMHVCKLFKIFIHKTQARVIKDKNMSPILVSILTFTSTRQKYELKNFNIYLKYCNPSNQDVVKADSTIGWVLG